MTPEQAEKVYLHWAEALKACLAEGISHSDVIPAFLALDAGCLRGLVGPETSRQQILRLRDDMHRAMTELADHQQARARGAS